MPTQASAPRDGTVIAHGYGLKIYVHRGHLVVHDGVGRDRQTRRFNRATGKLKRLVVLGHTGYVTLDALRWLKQIGAALVQLDHHGDLVALSVALAPNLPQLRRAQALAATSTAGIEVARLVLSDKLRGQQAVAAHMLHGAASTAAIGAALDQLVAGAEFDELLGAEAAAANAYWDIWASVAVRFGRRDHDRVPKHWHCVGPRHSPLTRSPRVAATPAHAILNYLYALLEAETTLACHAVGLDPSLGVFHTDKAARHSLALDLMEAARPAVDAYLLWLLRERCFRARDFVETPRGACRMTPTLTRELAHTVTVWGSHAAPIAEQVAQLLSANVTPTRLTEANRVAAWDGRRRGPAGRSKATPELPARCRDCGTSLADRRRRICDRCRRERAAAVGEAGRASAADVLARLRGEGRDPAHGGQAAMRRGEKNARHQHAVRAWNEDHEPLADPEVFRRDILPTLADARIDQLIAATGLSEHYCSLIRLGKRVPHPRHWEALSGVGRPSPSDEAVSGSCLPVASNLRP